MKDPDVEWLKSLLVQVEQTLAKLTVIQVRLEAALDVSVGGAATDSDPSESEQSPSADE